ncbi:MAG TPA: hypothetical protein VMS17_26060 [Gemmataceae bacterium]|nr:hypothetical protein [Gemmataceae bacterium]
MRTILTAALCTLVFGSAAVQAGDREDALAILDQAIQAQGGADALAKFRTAIRHGEGVVYQGDDKRPFTDEMTLDVPDRLQRSAEIDKQVHFAIAVAGDKGWHALGGKVEDLGPERLKELHEEIYVLWLETLLPLRDKGFDLTPLPEIKVNGRPAVGVQASSKGHADVKLYFDKTTHLLTKGEWSGKEAGQSHAKEHFIGDFKDFDGVKLPTHYIETTDGKKICELTSASYQFPVKVDDAAFVRP